MLYCPKYSVGSIVLVLSGEEKIEGKIVSIEATLKVGKSGKESYKVIYLVEIDDIGSTKKFHETQIKDIERIDPETNEELDKFLADSLLLAKHQFPENSRVDNTINQLLKLDSTGGETE